MNLSELILNVKADRSYEQLAALCGGSPTAARMQQLATKPLKNFPDPQSITGMAAGFGVHVRTVVEAAAESLGLPIAGRRSRLEILLPPEHAELSDDQIDRVLDLVNSYVDLNAARRSRERFERYNKSDDSEMSGEDAAAELNRMIIAMAEDAGFRETVARVARGARADGVNPKGWHQGASPWADVLDALIANADAVRRENEKGAAHNNVTELNPSPFDPAVNPPEPNELRDEPYLLDEAAREDTGQPNPGEGDDEVD